MVFFVNGLLSSCFDCVNSIASLRSRRYSIAVTAYRGLDADQRHRGESNVNDSVGAAHSFQRIGH
jgi:hypothetical protein